jgi:AmmeMemoRadiSam system protein B
MTGSVRKPAVAGSWYPGTAASLASAVDGYLAVAERSAVGARGELTALIAPHAGLMYSGPVAAHAYRLLRGRTFDVAVLVGPSHFIGFDGVSLYASGGFETPFGVAPIDVDCARAIAAASPIVQEHPASHAREHSLEMQLPFIERLAPSLPIVPLLMGYQTRETATALGAALAKALVGRRALLVASTDLSHYHDAAAASALDRVVIDCVARFDAEGLQSALEARPEHACGGGPMVAVMRAAQAVGARDAIVLNYADSGDVSGDKSAVVGYLAAALGTFDVDRVEQ